MTEQEILDGNILIAKFKGYESYSSRGFEMFIFEEDNHRSSIDLHYHDSWEWILPVVSQIEQRSMCMYQFHINGFGCFVTNRGDVVIDRTVTNLPKGTTKQQAVWMAVVEFIKYTKK